MPLVSVITPLYRAEPFVRDLAESVCAQTLPDLEWICADDCSPDDSARLLQDQAGGRVDLRVIRLPRNGGPGAARNAALRIARGRYVAFLDADDTWLPEKLARQVAFMEANGHSFTFHDYRRVGANGEVPSLPT